MLHYYLRRIACIEKNKSPKDLLVRIVSETETTNEITQREREREKRRFEWFLRWNFENKIKEQQTINMEEVIKELQYFSMVWE